MKREHDIECAFFLVAGGILATANHGASLPELILRALIGFPVAWGVMHLLSREPRASP